MVYQCNVCDRDYDSEVFLTVHCAVYHRDADASKGKCPHCDKVLTRNDSLYRHILNIHYKLKRYKCHICKRPFASSYNMKQHIYSHSTVCTFACTDCPNVYKTKRNLNTHLKRAHHYTTPQLYVKNRELEQKQWSEALTTNNRNQSYDDVKKGKMEYDIFLQEETLNKESDEEMEEDFGQSRDGDLGKSHDLGQEDFGQSRDFGQEDFGHDNDDINSGQETNKFNETNNNFNEINNNFTKINNSCEEGKIKEVEKEEEDNYETLTPESLTITSFCDKNQGISSFTQNDQAISSYTDDDQAISSFTDQGIVFYNVLDNLPRKSGDEYDENLSQLMKEYQGVASVLNKDRTMKTLDANSSRINTSLINKHETSKRHEFTSVKSRDFVNPEVNSHIFTEMSNDSYHDEPRVYIIDDVSF